MSEIIRLIPSNTASDSIEKLTEKVEEKPYITLPTFIRERNNVLYVINSLKTGQNIGLISLYDINTINQNACIDGFVFDESYTQELVIGYIQLIHMGMVDMKLNRIYAKHLIGNSYYKRIYDFLRFTLEGDLREDVKRLGKFYSVQVRSLLQHEFKRVYLSGDKIRKMCNLDGF